MYAHVTTSGFSYLRLSLTLVSVTLKEKGDSLNSYNSGLRNLLSIVQGTGLPFHKNPFTVVEPGASGCSLAPHY